MSKERLKKIVSKTNKTYYVDIENKRVCDSLGNWISFKEDFNGVIESNSAIYIERLFNGFYELVENFNDDLYYDKKEKILWG